MIATTVQELPVPLIDMSTPATRSHVSAVTRQCRQWLSDVGNLLIPASETMPCASDADVSAGQLDVVLKARPDLAGDLQLAWSRTVGLPPAAVLDHLRTTDPGLYQSVCLIVAGGYYTNREVIKRLGYTGQQPRTAQIGGDIDEDLLIRVVERGPRYRQA
ncbi:hypothetical protein A5638_20255 [Mycolicibacterium fortuitum]|uniref:hypothetical protein n=1 Tax=Mycolicibacterium fortuitum TaxID=1766 RepID=UPI0007EE213A|nr:hypothetical protein [Mycolicibacterium fortuitum]OBJ95442.1 hypothetical protein A5638_20255 [Mycolicibacterium fortuitum]